jgi:outer membrane biosynthesis protein TonB
MANGAPSFLGSVLLHAGVIGLALIAWPKEGPAPREMMGSVPVSIVSDVTVLAAAPDNPADELITEDGSSSPEAPAETLPDPVPETPPVPRPDPAPRTTPRAEPERPRTPPRQPPSTPRQPTPPREEPGLNLGELSERPQRGTTSGRPSTGDSGAGQAPRAMGRADLNSVGTQVTPNWNPPCHLPGIEEVTLRVQVRMSEDGRLVGSPRVLNPRSDATGRAASDSILRAIRIPPRYRMPVGYEEQDFVLNFPLAQACNR